jgi:hypothetical protein
MSHLSRLLVDRSGMVAAEFAIVLSTIGLAALIAGQAVAPAAHAWVERSYVAVVEADAKLDALCAALRSASDGGLEVDLSMCPEA